MALLDWRIKAVFILMMVMMGGVVFLASSIRSTISSYLRLDKVFR